MQKFVTTNHRFDKLIKEEDERSEKLITSKLAKKLEMKTSELLEKLVNMGYLTFNKEKYKLTVNAETIGAEYLHKARLGGDFLWPKNFKLINNKVINMNKELPVVLVKTWMDLVRSKEASEEVRQRALSMLNRAFNSNEDIAIYMKKHGLK